MESNSQSLHQTQGGSDTIKHFGRHINAELRTALTLGPPPTFDGATCGCGCGLRHNLQIDHIDPLANHGPTSLDNLQPLTAGHHTLKTKTDRQAGLLNRRRPRQQARPRTTTSPTPGATDDTGTLGPNDERGPP